MRLGGWLVLIGALVVGGLGAAAHFEVGPFAPEGSDVDALRTDGTLPAVPGESADHAGVDPADAGVMVLGDSVTRQSSDEIADLLGERDVSVIGLQGYRTDELLPTARDVFGGDSPPPVAVVMAGYNDVWQGNQVAGSVDEMIDLMAASPCAIWLLIPTEGPWDPAVARAFDDAAVAAAEAAGVNVETGWRDVVDDDPGDRPNPGLIGPDQVHPLPDGREQLAEVMATSVARFCPA